MTNLYCNLTNKKLKYPVNDKDGYIYENLDIIMWITKYHTSPMTGKYMTVYDLSTNIKLRNKIHKPFYHYFIPYSLLRSFLKFIG